MLIIALSLATTHLGRTPHAPPPPPPPPASIAPYAAENDQADTELRGLTARVHSPVASDADLRAEAAALPAVQAKLDDVLANLTPRLQEADARLAQLGPTPSAGQPAEEAEVGDMRRGVGVFREAVDTEVKQARLLTVEVEQTGRFLAERRRKLFAAQLWRRTPSLFGPTLWRELAISEPGDRARVERFAASTVDHARTAAGGSTHPVVWLATALIALGILGPLRLVLGRVVRRRWGGGLAEGEFARSAPAVLATLTAVAAPLVAGALMRGVFTTTGALTPLAAVLLDRVIGTVTFGALIGGLGRALLRPEAAQRRMAPLADSVAARLTVFPGLIGGAAAMSSVAAGLATSVGLSRPTTDALEAATLVVELAVLTATLCALGRGRPGPAAETDGLAAPRTRRPSATPWVVAIAAAWLATIAAILSLAAGYATLAGFLTRELVWIGLVLALLFLLSRFVDDAVTLACSPERALGRGIQRASGLAPATLEQFGVLASGLGRLVLFVVAWGAILAPFGASAGEALDRFTASDLVLRLGQLSISPAAVAGAAAVFLLGLAATRVVRRWLEETYLPKTTIDLGVRASLASSFTYLGALIAIVLACAYMGLSLDRIALFASALSVGIGFGLQSIIGNFVSGLILLAERPVKVGDWIAIGELEGDVRRINVRATEIEMMDRSRLIVPNSDLISKTVRNVTHSGAIGRVKIVLKLDDAADPLVVRDIVVACLESHPEVLPDPPPGFFMNDVRDGALEFTAFAYVASARLAYRIKSELLFEVVPALRAQSVAFASSNPVVNVGLDRPIEPPPEEQGGRSPRG